MSWARNRMVVTKGVPSGETLLKTENCTHWTDKEAEKAGVYLVLLHDAVSCCVVKARHSSDSATLLFGLVCTFESNQQPQTTLLQRFPLTRVELSSQLSGNTRLSGWAQRRTKLRLFMNHHRCIIFKCYLAIKNMQSRALMRYRTIMALL